MKKIIEYSALCAVAMMLLMSCYKDTGNYDYKQQLPFLVDTTGTPNVFTVQKSVTMLNIDPRIVFDGETVHLKYLWRIYSTSSANMKVDTLSGSKVFSGTINNTPGTYWLELQVTDTVTSIKAMMQYSVTVTSAYPYGWMVLYEKDGGSEIGLLRTSDIISGLTKDTVLLDAYETVNKRRLPGLPLKIQQSGRMWFAGDNFGAYVVYAITTTGGAMMDYVSFDYLTDYLGMFLSKPDQVKPDGFEGGLGLLANNKQIYSTYQLSPFFTGPAVEPDKDYEVNEASFTSTDYNVYDQKNMRFVIMSP
ncbi:MAG TPA: PKD-like family lipoprotein, partial [Chitinophaga sp.]|nr:PKD-like family lipoprotein [Chitinophaga sp.]